jgi:3-dehydrosphinganine reductase
MGRAIAHLMVRDGAHVSILARREGPLSETLDELEDLRVSADQRLRACSADVADWKQVVQALSALTQGGHPVDVLVNAAGIVHCATFEDLTMEEFDRTMDVDLKGTVHTVKAVLPSMMERRRGRIVNFSSMLGYATSFGYTAYSAAKFAVRGFTDSLRHELKPHGIHVSLVFPQDTDTPQLYQEREMQPEEARSISEHANRVLDVHHVAQIIVRGIEKGQMYILPGLESKVSFVVYNGPPFVTNMFRWFYVDRIVARVFRSRGEEAGSAG